jgi:hypothetical protein
MLKGGTRMGRRLAVSVLLVGFLLLPAQAAPYLGRVAQVIGSATLNGHPARLGMTVMAGDRLRTASKSRVDLIWRNGSAMRLMPGSEMVVRRWDTEQHVALSFGGLLSVLAKGVRYRTSSTNAVAAVTGTVYYQEESKELPGYVCVCKGSVNLGAPDAHTLTPVTGLHHKAMAIKPAAVKEVGMIDGHHTDQDIAELEALQKKEKEQTSP